MNTAPAEATNPYDFTREQKIFSVAGTLLGLLLAALDNTIVATAGPVIQKDLDIAPSLYAWLTTSYLVASTVMIPIWGKLSDLYGRRRMLMTGIVIFLIGSALCGLSGSAEALIASRAVQGIGAASLFTSAFAIIADLFPPADRGRLSGLFGAVFGLSSVFGPLVGGFITDTLSWHWAFFINLPLGAIAMGFILARMPRLKQHQQGKRPSIDVLGAITLLVGVVPLLLVLSLGRSTLAPGELGVLWTSWQSLSLFALALAGTVAFLTVERRAQDPILDLSLFRNRVFTIGNLASFVVGATFLGPIVFLPLFMVNVVGLSATSSGLTITPLTLGLVAGNVLSGLLVARTGSYKPLLLGSLVLLAAAMAVMAFTLTPDATQASVTLKMVLLGLGLGPSIPLFTLAVQNAVDIRKTGVATAASTFFRSLGNVVGVALLGTVFAGTLNAQLATVQRSVAGDLPPAARAQLGVGGGFSAEGSSAEAFDIDRVLAGVDQQFDRQERLIEQAAQGDPTATRALLASPQTPEPLRRALQAGQFGPQVAAGALAALNQTREQVTGALRTFEEGFRVAMTNAVVDVFLVGLIVAALSFLITLFLPQVPLRRGGEPRAPTAE